jgi:hypothetical protein
MLTINPPGELARGGDRRMGEDKDSKSKDSQTYSKSKDFQSNDLALGDESAAGVKGGQEVTEPVVSSQKLGHKHKSKRSRSQRPV